MKTSHGVFLDLGRKRLLEAQHSVEFRPVCDIPQIGEHHGDLDRHRVHGRCFRIGRGFHELRREREEEGFVIDDGATQPKAPPSQDQPRFRKRVADLLEGAIAQAVDPLVRIDDRQDASWQPPVGAHQRHSKPDGKPRKRQYNPSLSPIHETYETVLAQRERTGSSHVGLPSLLPSPE
ncbi:MAG: hypothetical protein BWY56_00243 [Acidobacteria bacterium ADurb.Bin340]|nr:MAG: hypothetical protein BWY56_00243 [Acidobacteria bacterium ADurb.Bin340]